MPSGGDYVRQPQLCAVSRNSTLPRVGTVPTRSAWYYDGMRTTIDKAGRVVIPAAIRDRAGFAAGSALEIREDELGIRLERVASGPRLVRVGRRLVARPTVPPDSRPVIDVEALIEDERNRWP